VGLRALGSVVPVFFWERKTKMKKLIAGVAVVALLVVVGCDTKGKIDTNGGPTAAAAFSIKAPATMPEVKPGEKQDVKLAIERGKDFKDEMTLKFEAPKGVSVEPETKAVPATEKEIAVKVAAAADAPEGKQTVTITATPKTGKVVTAKFDVNVKKGEAK
jgi:uncharacterized membrane protein